MEGRRILSLTFVGRPIVEPMDSSRNSYWRQRPRETIDFGIRIASRKPEAPTNAQLPRKAGMVE
jgi:hypothetical protein